MSIDRQAHWVRVTMPEGVCLYEDKAYDFLRSLVRFAESLHHVGQSEAPNPVAGEGSIRGVLVVQAAPAHDCTPTWLNELEETALFRDLVGRLDTYRWLLSLIRNSPIPWVYMSAHDCLGSAWELAMSCQRRYWFSPEVRLGLPEIEGGTFPPGGVLESLSRRGGHVREKWQATPCMSARDAFETGLLDFCVAATDWEPLAQSFFEEVLATKAGSSAGGGKRKRRREDYFDIRASPASGEAAYEQLEAVWRQERVRFRKYPSAWDYCWQLVKERSKLKDPQDLGRLVAHIAAGHFLSAGYQAWIATRLADSNQLLVREQARNLVPSVIIDLGGVMPPTLVFARMLHRRVAVSFRSHDAKSLASALTLLFNRLERTLSAAEAQALWARQVTWFQDDLEAAVRPVLRWTVDDVFTVSLAEQEFPFLRLEGNGSAAQPGILEWRGGPLSAEIREIIGLVSEGCVGVPPVVAELAVSTHLRSLFFEELLAVSRHMEGDLGAVISALKNAEWRFASDEEAWDRFLRMRHDASLLASEASKFLGRPMERTSWEIGTWKHARNYAKRQPLAERHWNPTATSQHLALFLGRIVETLAGDGVERREVTDYLATLALGFPSNYGTPLGYMRRYGRRRIAAYSRQHWPHMPAAFHTQGA